MEVRNEIILHPDDPVDDLTDMMIIEEFVPNEDESSTILDFPPAKLAPKAPFFTVEVVEDIKSIKFADGEFGEDEEIIKITELEIEKKSLNNSKYYEMHKERLKEKRRRLHHDVKHMEHDKFMNKKRYYESKKGVSTPYQDIDHQSNCSIGLCASFIHPSKLQKRSRNQRYYKNHKEQIKKRRQESDEQQKSHSRFMNKKRYYELRKNHTLYEDPVHQTMCNVGICAEYVPFLKPNKSSL